MSRKSFQHVFVLAILGVAFCAYPVETNAAWLTTDADFGAQTIGSTLASPWTAFGGGGSHTVTSNSQSPFTNVFANTNGKGANAAALSGNPYFVNNLTTPIATDATGFVYLNVDFRNTSAEETDGYVLAVSNTQFNHALFLSIRGDNGLQAVTGNGLGGVTWTDILDPVVGTWYNVQLTLDLTHQSYSGTVTPFGGSAVTIAGGSFIHTNVGITNIFSDGGNDGGQLTAPAHDIDNFGLSTTAIPEPGILPLLLAGLAGLLAYAWRKSK